MKRLFKFLVPGVLTAILAAGCSQPSAEEELPEQAKVYYLFDTADSPTFQEVEEKSQMHMTYSHFEQSGKDISITAEITDSPGSEVHFVLPEGANEVFSDPVVSSNSSKNETKTSTYEVTFEVKEAYFAAHPNTEVVYETAWEQIKGDQKYTILKSQTSILADEVL